MMASLGQRVRVARQLAREKGIAWFVRDYRNFLLWTTMNKIFIQIMARKFQRLAHHAETLQQAIDLLFSFEYFGASVSKYQQRWEISKFLEIVKETRPSVVLEIGTAKGGTLFLFSRAVREDALLISVDLPGGPFFGGRYEETLLPSMVSLTGRGQRLRLIRSDSHSTNTKREIEQALGGRPVDFLFIDGDHSYEGVRKDFEMYSPLVRKGGIIAFHDICAGPPVSVGGVPRFWKEVSVSRKSETIIKDPNQGGFGIGVIYC